MEASVAAGGSKDDGKKGVEDEVSAHGDPFAKFPAHESAGSASSAGVMARALLQASGLVSAPPGLGAKDDGKKDGEEEVEVSAHECVFFSLAEEDNEEEIIDAFLQSCGLGDPMKDIFSDRSNEDLSPTSHNLEIPLVKSIDGCVDDNTSIPTAELRHITEGCYYNDDDNYCDDDDSICSAEFRHFLEGYDNDDISDDCFVDEKEEDDGEEDELLAEILFPIREEEKENEEEQEKEEEVDEPADVPKSSAEKRRERKRRQRQRRKEEKARGQAKEKEQEHDDSGEINAAVLHKAMQIVGVETTKDHLRMILEVDDDDGPGTVDYQEFLKRMMIPQVMNHGPTNEISKALRLFDRGYVTGKISYKNLMRISMQLGRLGEQEMGKAG